MAPPNSQVTTTPLDLVSTHSLTTGVAYQVYNSGGSEVLIWEDDTSPTPPVTGAQVIHPDRSDNNRVSALIKPNGSDGIWVWTNENPSHVTIYEVV